MRTRARRAFHMIQLGEVSAGRQALEGASLATGDERTLKALKDPARRPPLPRDPVPHDIAQFEPGECFSLDQELFSKNVRTARKGAAPGPSGMTADHLRPLVEHVAVAAALSQGTQRLGVGVSSSQSVQRRWSQGPHKRFCARHGFGTARPRGWRGGGRAPSLRRIPVSH